MDYAAIAKKYGGTTDYSAIASKYGGTSTVPVVNKVADPRDAMVTSQANAPKDLGIGSKVGNFEVPKAIFNALTSSEQKFGGALSTVFDRGSQNSSDMISKQLNQAQATLVNKIQTEQDPVKKIRLIEFLKKQQKGFADPSVHPEGASEKVATTEELNPNFSMSNKEVLGAAGGTALDVTLAGSYGKAAQEGRAIIQGLKEGGTFGEAGQTLLHNPEAGKLVKGGADILAKQVAPKTVKEIAKKTLVRSAVGGATGYGYDVSQNLQEGKTGAEAFKPGGGTAGGIIVPLAIGGIQAGVALSKETAPKFINSLIKPKTADFSYGKDPGRTVSEMGITGNNLNDFADNIHTAKQDIGKQLGAIYVSPENVAKKIDVSDELRKIDDAIQKAAKGGKENQSIVTTLQNIKDALLFEHGLDKEGNIVKIGETPRDLTNLTPKEAFDFKQMVAEHTKFTGKPSDDKTVNSVLKNVYGGIKEKLNTTVGVANPEIIDLNQKYADLTSAELATRNRDAIVRKSDMVSLKSGGAGVVASGAALLAGTAALPATLAGITAAGLEKAMETTAVRTRIAAWLGSESPGVISKLIQKNPGIKTVLYRLLPKLSSKIGK